MNAKKTETLMLRLSPDDKAALIERAAVLTIKRRKRVTVSALLLEFALKADAQNKREAKQETA